MTAGDHPSDAGFTLVELLVALFIFALVASISMGFLYQTLDSKAVLQERLDQLEKMKLARSIIKMDLLQMTRRPTRGIYGDPAMPAFQQHRNSTDQRNFLTLVRSGVSNPGSHVARSNLQHVSYSFQGGRLIRRARVRLDPTPRTPVREQVLLEGLRDLEIKFLVGGRWQSAATGAGDTDDVMPQAVSLRASSDRYGDIEQLFLLGGPGVVE